MTDDHALLAALLDRKLTISPAPGKPASNPTTFGAVFDEAGRLITAGFTARGEHLLLQLQRAAPDAAPIDLRLVDLYISVGQYRQALPILDRVLDREPENIAALTGKAHVMFRLNRAGDAARLARTVRSLAPADPDNLNNLGVYLVATGDFAAAAEAYEQAVEMRPDFVAAWHNLLRLPGQDLDPAQLGQLERLAAADDLPVNDRAIAYLCVSRYHRNRHDPVHEFEYLDRGKSLLSDQKPWDEAGFARQVDELTALDGARIEALCRPRSTLVTPLFICSMPRAGSTLLEQLLATHPDVGSIGEAGLATTVLNATIAEHGLDEPQWWRWLDGPDAERLMTSVRLAFDRALAGFVSTTAFVCEKSINNDVMLGLGLLAYPDAVAIHCRRDPLDVCLSAYQTHLPQLEYTNRLGWLATRHQLHDRLMAHWRHLFPGRIIEVAYERLVADPEREIERILAATGLERPVDGIDLERRIYSVNTASNWQVRQPIYRTSCQRWHRYADQLDKILYLNGEDGSAGPGP